MSIADTLLPYKGYVATIEYDPDEDLLQGHVVNTRDTLVFYGASVDDLRRELATSIDDYIAFCRERGETPERPFAGKISLRMDPSLHGRLVSAAASEHKSLNNRITERLEEAVSASPTKRVA